MSNRNKIVLSSETLSQLEKVATTDDFFNHHFNEKVKYVSSLFANLIEATKIELSGFFNEKEAKHLSICLFGGAFDFYRESAKHLLCWREYMNPDFSKCSKLSTLEVEVLISKINSLSEFQSFVVIQMYYDYERKIDGTLVADSSFLKEAFRILN